MKKILTILIALIVLCTATLTGCSCNPEVALTFSNNFYNEGAKPQDVSDNFSETLTYDVSWFDKNSDYSSIALDSAVKSAITINENTYKNGTYTSTLQKVLMGYPSDLPESKVASKLNAGNDVFLLTTDFNITVDYSEDGSNPIDNYIRNTVYFCYSLNSFAPIYVKTETKQTLLYVSGEKAVFETFEGTYTTVYQTESYRISSKIITLDKDGQPKSTQKKSKSYSYTAKTVVDNSQFFFILRNLSTSNEESTSLPVVSPSYGTKQTLSIKHEKGGTKLVNFKYNGADPSANETIPVKHLSYAVSSTKASGRKQYCVYQTGKSTVNSASGIVNRNTAMLVEYAEPLVALGSMNCLGGLKFTLSSVQNNYQ